MGNPTSDIDNLDTEQLFQEMDAAKEDNEKRLIEGQRIALRLMRAKSWSLVRDLFMLEIHNADIKNVKWAELNMPVPEIGQRVVIAEQVQTHLLRILSTIDALVAAGVERESGEKMEDLQKKQKKAKDAK